MKLPQKYASHVNLFYMLVKVRLKNKHAVQRKIVQRKESQEKGDNIVVIVWGVPSKEYIYSKERQTEDGKQSELIKVKLQP
jgi:hypothetical protein